MTHSITIAMRRQSHVINISIKPTRLIKRSFIQSSNKTNHQENNQSLDGSFDHSRNRRNDSKQINPSLLELRQLLADHEKARRAKRDLEQRYQTELDQSIKLFNQMKTYQNLMDLMSKAKLPPADAYSPTIQSMNQTISQSHTQPVTSSSYQLKPKHVDRSINQSINGSTNHDSDKQSISQSIDRSIDPTESTETEYRSIISTQKKQPSNNQSFDQSIDPPIRQRSKPIETEYRSNFSIQKKQPSSKQPIDQSVDPPIRQKSIRSIESTETEYRSNFSTQKKQPSSKQSIDKSSNLVQYSNKLPHNHSTSLSSNQPISPPTVQLTNQTISRSKKADKQITESQSRPRDMSALAVATRDLLKRLAVYFGREAYVMKKKAEQQSNE